MDSEQLHKAFFSKLNDIVLREEKKLHRKSLLLTLAKVNSNKASKYLNDSSIRVNTIDKTAFRELAEKSIIRPGDNSHDEYVITAEGVWEYEKKFNGLSERDLVQYIQQKNFAPSSSNRPINDRERVVLISMIGIRNFSLSSVMDVNDEAIREYWLEIFKESYNFLLLNGFIRQDKTIFAIQGNEHPVSYLMVRLNDLPKVTHHLFQYGKGRKYYLDIVDDAVISKNKLKLLFKMVFNTLNGELQKMKIINEFLLHLANDKSKFVRDNFDYIDSNTSLLIKDALQEFFIDE